MSQLRSSSVTGTVGAFPVFTAGFQPLSPDWPGVMPQKLLYKIQTTTPTHQRAAPACARSVRRAWGKENLAIPSTSPPLVGGARGGGT